MLAKEYQSTVNEILQHLRVLCVPGSELHEEICKAGFQELLDGKKMQSVYSIGLCHDIRSTKYIYLKRHPVLATWSTDTVRFMINPQGVQSLSLKVFFTTRKTEVQTAYTTPYTLLAAMTQPWDYSSKQEPRDFRLGMMASWIYCMFKSGTAVRLEMHRNHQDLSTRGTGIVVYGTDDTVLGVFYLPPLAFTFFEKTAVSLFHNSEFATLAVPRLLGCDIKAGVRLEDAIATLHRVRGVVFDVKHGNAYPKLVQLRALEQILQKVLISANRLTFRIYYVGEIRFSPLLYVVATPRTVIDKLVGHSSAHVFLPPVIYASAPAPKRNWPARILAWLKSF
jgi:hypothetical protein